MWLVNRERLRPLSEWLLTHLPSRCRADKEGSGGWGSTGERRVCHPERQGSGTWLQHAVPVSEGDGPCASHLSHVPAPQSSGGLAVGSAQRGRAHRGPEHMRVC